MRVKLSYTVDDEVVLEEAAKLLGLSANEVQRVLSYFTQIQEELVPDKEAGRPEINIDRVLSLLDKYRNALLNIDTRVQEVSEIIVGYRDYHIASSEAPTPQPGVAEPEGE